MTDHLPISEVMMIRSKQNGYTIIELMIVIVIIGILASIAIPNYRGILNRAEKSACLANQRTIEMARMYYSITNNSYGLSMADIQGAFSEIGFIGDGKTENLVCPSGGSYLFEIGTFDIICSITEHNN